MMGRHHFLLMDADASLHEQGGSSQWQKSKLAPMLQGMLGQTKIKSRKTEENFEAEGTGRCDFSELSCW